MFFDIIVDTYSETFPAYVLLIDDDETVPETTYWQNVDDANILDVNGNPIEAI